jgi:S-adenosylmethionine-diacylgycerolhomoserine-N-methlytransferase
LSTPIGGDLHGYYRLHAPIYDLTRPFFLFGRSALVRRLVRHWQEHGTPELAPRVLEIGCGTGSNLALLGRLLPTAQLVGVDLALPMLERARKRLGHRAQLLHGAIGEVDTGRPFDLVLASYMLSMSGPALRDCIRAAKAALAPGGVFGVVDFERSASRGFTRWMRRNHVTMNGQLASTLEQSLAPREVTRRSALGGLWTYLQWLGQRDPVHDRDE